MKFVYYDSNHLYRFIKPAVGTVPLAASSMHHLEDITSGVHVIGHLRHGFIQTYYTDAPLDS